MCLMKARKNFQALCFKHDDLMKTGETYTLSVTVSEMDTAEKIGSGGLPVYSTPSMIGHMETAAYNLAAAHGLQTVGTKVVISHLRACRPGTEIRICATLVEEEGRRLEFKVCAEDAKGLIGEGRHQRYVIDAERFMSRLD